MKLLTHNLMTSKCVKGVLVGFPLGIVANEVKQTKVDFNPDFIARMIPKLDWDALCQAASSVGCSEELPRTLSASYENDEEFLKKAHHVLLEPFLKAVSRNFATMSSSESQPSSQIRQNYHEDSEKGVNDQINMELYASYVYLSMSFYFDRDDVALHGLSKYFKDMSDEEREHAQKLMKFQNQRGGKIILKDVKRPEKDDWESPLVAMEEALALEKKVNASLLNLHKVASDHVDPQMCDFLETHYLTEQVESIKQIADYVTNLKRVGTGLGEFIFDKEFRES